MEESRFGLTLAPLLKLLMEAVKRLILGSLTNGLCRVPEASAHLHPQLLAISHHPFGCSTNAA